MGISSRGLSACALVLCHSATRLCVIAGLRLIVFMLCCKQSHLSHFEWPANPHNPALAAAKMHRQQHFKITGEAYEHDERIQGICG